MTSVAAVAAVGVAKVKIAAVLALVVLALVALALALVVAVALVAVVAALAAVVAALVVRVAVALVVLLVVVEVIVDANNEKQSSGKQLRITQVRSSAGRLENQRRTLVALGIRKIHQTVVKQDSPMVRGMVATVAHLVHVEEIGTEEAMQ